MPLGWFAEHGYDGEGGWRVSEDESAADVFGFYRREIEKSNEIIAATPLDGLVRQTDSWFAGDVPTVSSVLFHAINETACHTGHLDAVRELIDGRQWSSSP
jgi:Protein of unknown function (DUF664)